MTTSSSTNDHSLCGDFTGATGLRVLHIVSGDSWAGAEVQAFTLFTHLQDVLDLHVLVMNEGELASRCRKAGIRTRVIDESTHSPGQLFSAVRQHLKAVKPDIVHTHRQKENVLGSLANLLSVRAKCVRTVHGAPEFSPTAKQKLQIALDTFCGRCLQNSVIGVSADLGRKLEQRFPKRKLHVIPNGIDPGEIREQLTLPDFIGDHPNHALQVGIVGRLVPVKRVDLFLEMAAILLRRRPESRWQFHVFGDGPLRESLQSQAASLGIEEHVRFHGHRSDVRSCIAALDAVVMPSDHEGLPMTALESLALGVPLVAHDVGGLRELLKARPEYLVADHAPGSYAATLIEVLERPGQPAALGADYLASTNAKRVFQLYQTLLSSPAVKWHWQEAD